MQFNYKDVMDRGFKREDSHDQIFIDEYGFDWFIVTLKLAKGLHLDWDCNTREVWVLRTKGGFIKSKYQVTSMKQLEDILEFFKK